MINAAAEPVALTANTYHEALDRKDANPAIATYRTCHKRPPESKATVEAPGESSTVTIDEGIYSSFKLLVDEDENKRRLCLDGRSRRRRQICRDISH